MRIIKRWIIRMVLKYLIDGLPGNPGDLSDGERATALIGVYNSPELKKMLNIRTINLVQRNLYSTNMEESSFYKGRIFELRWLLKEADGEAKGTKT